jgi:hypothetical protein
MLRKPCAASLWLSNLNPDARLIHRLKAFSRKRNATSYDSAGNVSSEELRSLIKTADALHRQVIAWLQDNHPGLL